MSEHELYESLSELDEAARNLWHRQGLASVIEVSSLSEVCPVRFKPYANRSLAPSEVRDLLQAIRLRPQPSWQIKSCELRQLFESAQHNDSRNRVTITLSEGQGGTGVWNLTILPMNHYDSDFELNRLVARVVDALGRN